MRASTSHTPWCCMGASKFDAATQNSFGGLGCVVHLVVHGQRHAYNTAMRSPESELLGPNEDWRKNFLEAAPGRIISR